MSTKMLLRIVIGTFYLSSIVTGQTGDFEQECNILKTLDNLEVRLQKQETLVEQQNTRIQQQQAQLDNQTTELQKQEGILDSQTTQLKQQEVLLKNQTTLLQRKDILLEQTEDRIRELEAEIATLPGDCGVLFENGTTQSGVYAISPDGRCSFDVYCDMTDGGWTVIQRRIDGAVNFTRTWDEYVQGFGDVNGEYWLGLEKIYRLAKDGADIYFDIEKYDRTREYAHYKSFTVHDATTLYKMNVDAFGYNGSLYEEFSYEDDMKFYTFDRDNDDSDFSNCAYSGGWWYRNCYKLGNFNEVFGEIKYSIGDYDYIYLKNITIKIKQKHC